MQKKIPMRKCVGCGQMLEKREMIRVLKTPEDEIILDKTLRANGRGAYICNSADCLAKAIKNKGLERSLKSPIPEEVSARLKEELS